jgi:hypothetical protein
MPYVAVGWDKALRTKGLQKGYYNSPVQQTAVTYWWNNTWLKRVKLLGERAISAPLISIGSYRNDPRHKLKLPP